MGAFLIGFMEEYLSIGGRTVTEKIIEKSRFITTSAHVESEEQAKAFIAEISKKYFDATHNCYAFICDTLGNLLRFSDDGEPQGTAGMPMLDVIKNKNLRQTAVVVTRYFGGIKLGAGGLVRAYSSAVAENLAVAKKVLYCECGEREYVVDYPLVDVCTRYFCDNECMLLNTEYSSEVKFTVATKSSNTKSFENGLINKLNGKVMTKLLKTYFYPFEIK